MSLLLKAYTHPKPESLLLTWLSTIDLETQADLVVVRLLAWLSPRLPTKQTALTEVWPRIRGIRRWIWTSQQNDLQNLRLLQRQLQSIGIPSILPIEIIPGQYSMAWDYRSDGLYIQEADRQTAIEMLRQIGWVVQNYRIPHSRYPLIDGIKLWGGQDRHIYLHWHLLPGLWHHQRDRLIWQDVVLPCLSPTHQLLLLSLHYWMHRELGPLLAADALTLIERNMKWEAVQEAIELYELQQPAGVFLSYLQNIVSDSVPNAVISRLQDKTTIHYVYNATNSRSYLIYQLWHLVKTQGFIDGLRAINRWFNLRYRITQRLIRPVKGNDYESQS